MRPGGARRAQAPRVCRCLTPIACPQEVPPAVFRLPDYGDFKAQTWNNARAMQQTDALSAELVSAIEGRSSAGEWRKTYGGYDSEFEQASVATVDLLRSKTDVRGVAVDPIIQHLHSGKVWRVTDPRPGFDSGGHG